MLRVLDRSREWIPYLVNAEDLGGHDLLLVSLGVDDGRSEYGGDALDRGRPLGRLLGSRGQVVHVGHLVVHQPHGGPFWDGGRNGRHGRPLVDLLVVGAGGAEAGVVAGRVEGVAARRRVGVLVEGRVLVGVAADGAAVAHLEDAVAAGPREGVRVGRHPGRIVELGVARLYTMREESKLNLSIFPSFPFFRDLIIEGLPPPPPLLACTFAYERARPLPAAGSAAVAVEAGELRRPPAGSVRSADRRTADGRPEAAVCGSGESTDARATTVNVVWRMVAAAEQRERERTK